MKYVNRFKVVPGSKVKLKDVDPAFKGQHTSHKDAAKEIEQDRTKLRELQELLYADGRFGCRTRFAKFFLARYLAAGIFIIAAAEQQGNPYPAFPGPHAFHETSTGRLGSNRQ